MYFVTYVTLAECIIPQSVFMNVWIQWLVNTAVYWWCCCASMFTYRLKQKQLPSTTYNLLERKQVSSYLWKNVLFTACYTYCVDSRISYSVKKLSRESKNKWVVCKIHHDYRRQSCGSDSIQLFDPFKCTCWELQVSTPCLLRI